MTAQPIEPGPGRPERPGRHLQAVPDPAPAGPSRPRYGFVDAICILHRAGWTVEANWRTHKYVVTRPRRAGEKTKPDAVMMTADQVNAKARQVNNSSKNPVRGWLLARPIVFGGSA